MSADDDLRQHVHNLLRGTTQRNFEAAVQDFPAQAMNLRPPHVDYTPWHLLEHIRVSQWDILDYIRNPHYAARRWPEEYWPPKESTADVAAWNKSVEGFRADRQALADLIADPNIDLLAPIAHTPGHSVLREVFLVAGHSAFHLGEFGILRQVMQTWPPDHQ
jgi:hypothetical protein